jgi:hypothetical protein
MKSEKELNSDILKLTMKIQNTRPELSKFISEMPSITTGPDGEEAKAQNLREYYNSLEALLNNYNITHGDATEIGS